MRGYISTSQLKALLVDSIQDISEHVTSFSLSSKRQVLNIWILSGIGESEVEVGLFQNHPQGNMKRNFVIQLYRQSKLEKLS